MYWLENGENTFDDHGDEDGHDNDTEDNGDDCGDYGDDVTFSGSKSGAWGGDSLNFTWKSSNNSSVKKVNLSLAKVLLHLWPQINTSLKTPILHQTT